MASRPSSRLLLAVTGAALAVATTGCETDLGSCPPDSDAQQSQGRQVVADYCSQCHDSGSDGTNRAGAPSGLDWDDLGAVRDYAADMYGETEGGDMPPENFLAGGMEIPLARPSAEELENMRIWLACGARDVPLP